jgi:hypothetical protein
MHRTRKTRNNNNNNNKYKKKKSCKRKYKKNINGINGGAVAATLATLDEMDAHITAAAGNLFTSAKEAYKTPYVAWPLTIYDAQRATKALVKNINEVYKFYLYCKTINKGNIDCPELLRRFTYALHQLGKNIKIFAESGLVAKIIKIIDSKLTKSEFVKEFDEMNIIIAELSRDSTLATPPSTFINRVSNTVMVGAYADWYRYELYIYANNLHMIVSEIMSVKLSGMCVSEADILHETGAMVRPSAASAAAAAYAAPLGIVPSTLRLRRIPGAHSSSSSSSGINEKKKM